MVIIRVKNKVLIAHRLNLFEGEDNENHEDNYVGEDERGEGGGEEWSGMEEKEKKGVVW